MSIFPVSDPSKDSGRLVRHLEYVRYLDVPNPLEGLGWDDVPRLAASDDPLDRVRLYALVRGPLHWIYAPPGTWCVVRTYTDNFMQPGPQSGHLSRENAEAWVPAWEAYNARLARGRENGPYLFSVEQRDDVMAADMRDPEADPFAATANLGRD